MLNINGSMNNPINANGLSVFLLKKTAWGYLFFLGIGTTCLIRHEE